MTTRGWRWLAMALAMPVLGEAAETQGWTPIADLRLRYETVDQIPLAETAEALTLRARLGLQTPQWWGTSLLAEGNFLVPLDSRYRPDNAVAYHSQYPLVADPRAHDLNRLALRTSFPGTVLTLGRQRIELDDQRFIGSVGWRQNEQTYDGVRVVNQSFPHLTLDLAYLDRVHRVYGEDSPQGVYHGDLVLANAAYQTPLGRLTAFTYLLSFDALTRFPGLTPAASATLNPAAASTSTWGGRFAGSHSMGPIKLGYLVSFAVQQPRSNNPYAFHNHYSIGELSVSWHGLELKAGDEVLSGNGTVGFSTPLGTVHAFDGWADKFLTTPANGLDNRHVSLAGVLPHLGVIRTLTVRAVYRHFAPEHGPGDYGREWDLQLLGKWGPFTPQLAWADYRAAADTPITVARDTRKLFLQVDYAL